MENNYKQRPNLKKGSYFFKKGFFTLIMLLAISPIVTMAHDGDEPKEKVEKVTENVLEKQQQSRSDSTGQAEDKQIKKDFAEISKAVETGTVPTVIKVLSLAVFIAGFAFLYLPKKKKGVANGQ
jgi:hypothetical protein